MTTTFQPGSQLPRATSTSLDPATDILVGVADADTTPVTQGIPLAVVYGKSQWLQPAVNVAAVKAVPTGYCINGAVLRCLNVAGERKLFEYDSASTAVSDDLAVVRPTFVASDASPGRWLELQTGGEVDFTRIATLGGEVLVGPDGNVVILPG